MVYLYAAFFHSELRRCGKEK